jgi:hypothetical protein
VRHQQIASISMTFGLASPGAGAPIESIKLIFNMHISD